MINLLFLFTISSLLIKYFLKNAIYFILKISHHTASNQRLSNSNSKRRRTVEMGLIMWTVIMTKNGRWVKVAGPEILAGLLHECVGILHYIIPQQFEFLERISL